MALKPDHKKVADFIIMGKDPIDAVMLVWPDLNRKAASNKWGRLGKVEELASYIKTRGDKIEARTTEKVNEAIASSQSDIILSSANKRVILAKIASGDMEVEKLVQVIDTDPESVTFNQRIWKKVKQKPDFQDIMKAIDLDNKMSGDNVQAKPNQTAKVEEVKRIIIKEDQTEPIKKLK